jgi:hypothetical protein
MPSRSTIGYACTAGALAVVAAIAYDAIPDLPLAPQSDEPKKADFVLAGRQDFLQPLLLVQTVRLANLIARYTDQLALVELGRTVAAMFGGLTVLATIVLALALAAGVLAAVPPLVAFHAQLLKEDIFLAPWLLFALAALDRLRESAETRRALAFGLLVGLATSAKYIGIVLLPLACVVPLIAPIADVRRYYAGLAWSTAAAAVVFALVNAPAFLTPGLFLRGLDTEIAHALSDHIVVWHGWYSHFLFHWTTSLWPGLGPTLALAGFGGAIAVAIDWRSSPPAIRLVLVFAVLWYIMHELSPMKPLMAIERHMTVMGGLVAVLAVGLVARVCNRASGAWRPALAASAVVVLAAPPAFTTIAIARSAPHDTRSMIERLRAALDGRDAVDWYASFPAHGHYPPLTTVDGATEYVVLVEETANRFVRAGTFPRQSERVRAYARAYGELLAQPAILVECRGLLLPQRAAADRGAPQQCRAARSRAFEARSAAGHPPHAGAEARAGGCNRDASPG